MQTAIYCDTCLFDCHHLAHIIVHWKCKNELLYSFSLFYFEFGGNFQVQAPGGLFLEGLTRIGGEVYFENFTVCAYNSIQNSKFKIQSFGHQFKTWLNLLRVKLYRGGGGGWGGGLSYGGFELPKAKLQ